MSLTRRSLIQAVLGCVAMAPLAVRRLIDAVPEESHIPVSEADTSHLRSLQAVGAHLWNSLEANWEGLSERSRAPWSQGVASEMVYWREEQRWFDVLDDLYPGELASYKLQWSAGERTASIVYFHGKSKPNNATPELQEHWS